MGLGLRVEVKVYRIFFPLLDLGRDCGLSALWSVPFVEFWAPCILYDKALMQGCPKRDHDC